MNIFILEDNYLSMKMYETALKHKFNIVMAHNSDDFHKKFDASNFDVALIDINIKDPQYTGIDLVNQYYTLKKGGKLIILSAYDEDDIEMPPWCDAYMQKPVQLAALESKIEKLASDKA